MQNAYLDKIKNKNRIMNINSHKDEEEEEAFHYIA